MSADCQNKLGIWNYKVSILNHWYLQQTLAFGKSIRIAIDRANILFYILYN